MLEPPKLTEAAITEALRAHYGLAVTVLAFLPIGNDSASFVYRVEADGAVCFLKVRAGAGFSAPSLAVPHYLHARGVPHIIAPLATRSGALWAPVGDFALSLYPFIDGRAGADVGLADEHWRELGATLKQIHTSPLTPDLARTVPRETFTPSRRNLIAPLEAAVARHDLAGPAERELAAFWRSHQDLIHTVVGRADALAQRLRQTPAPLVLCHADLHTWNVLLDEARRLWIVDWDETILALKERDLMFVVGGIGSSQARPHETACFLEGYGATTIDPCALTYYRYAWALQDIAAYGELVFFLPDLGEETRRKAVRDFTSLFEPGQIVDIALASDSAAL